MGFPCQFEGVVHPCVAKQVLLCQGSGRSLEVPRERDVLEGLWEIVRVFFWRLLDYNYSKIHTFYISLWCINYKYISVKKSKNDAEDGRHRHHHHDHDGNRIDSMFTFISLQPIL